MQKARKIGHGFLFVLLLATVAIGCSKPYDDGMLIPGDGLKALIIGSTSLAQALNLLGKTTHKKVTSTSSSINGGPVVYTFTAWVDYPATGLVLSFSGDLERDPFGGPGQRETIEWFQKNNIGPLRSVAVHAVKRGGRLLKKFKGATDKGVGLLDTKSELIEKYGRARIVRGPQGGRTIFLYQEGIIFFIEKDKQAQHKLIISEIRIREPFSREDLRRFG